jgi:hypothetical protein
MAEPSTPTAAPTPAAPRDEVSSADVRIVLFGLPAAGKSSLLGALGQAAHTQQHLLVGKLVDRSGGLEELLHQLYDDIPRRTADEVVPYPITFTPAPRPDQPSPGPIDAVVMDCDGRVANDLLVKRQALAEDSPEGSLAAEVALADTLILVVDASAPPAQVEADFFEFDRFLKAMEEARGQRAEVGGLPVYLVLTKCDLLAQPGDGAAAWMERIEQKKRDVDARFRDFLTRQNKTPFGHIDLHVWATAVKRPALAGPVKAAPREPYGVAELFRQCLLEAADFRGEKRRSGRRLAGLVIGSAGLVGVMVALTGTMLAVNRSSRTAALAARVEDLRYRDRGGPAERLRDRPVALHQKLADWEAVRIDPRFDSLPEELRALVEGRLDELKAYIPYLEKLLKERRPATVRTEEALLELQDRLKKELAPPRAEWSETDAGEIWARRVAEVDALNKAMVQARDWFQDAAESASKLWSFGGYRFGPEAAGVDWPDWTARVEELLTSRRPPFADTDRLPDAPGLTWGVVLRLDRVIEERSRFDAEKAKLTRLLNICSALGLATPAKERPAVLVVPRGITLAEVKARLAELKARYPDYPRAFTRKVLPDAIVPKVRQVARGSYQALLAPARQEVLRHLRQAGKGREDSEAAWEGVRVWLKEPAELAGWRTLAVVLLRLDEPDAEDPVSTLATFLAQKRFTINPARLTLEVPDRGRARPRAEARFVVLHPASDRQPALAFEPTGEPARDAARGVWTYSYRLAAGQRVFYRPGEKLWAELPLRDGKQRLVWGDCRSQRFQLERLRATPRIQAAGAASLTSGTLQEGVVLTFSPDETVPRVPDLVPQVQ